MTFKPFYLLNFFLLICRSSFWMALSILLYKESETSLDWKLNLHLLPKSNSKSHALKFQFFCVLCRFLHITFLNMIVIVIGAQRGHRIVEILAFVFQQRQNWKICHGHIQASSFVRFTNSIQQPTIIYKYHTLLRLIFMNFFEL